MESFSNYVTRPSFIPTANFMTKVSLHISCHKLINLDITSKSDPQVYVFQENVANKQWTEVGKTEMISDNLNPQFTQSVVINYSFSEYQNLKFLVVDVDHPGKGLKSQQIIGSYEVVLGKLISAPGSSVTKKLKGPNGKKTGYITVGAEEVKDLAMLVHLELEGCKLDKKDFFGSSDPFIRISRKRLGEGWDAVHKTEVIKKDLNPRWRRFTIPLQTLCNGDRNRPLLIECYDWNSSGKEDFIGGFQTSFADLEQAARNRTAYDLINPEKQKKRKYQNSGILRVRDCHVEKEVTFLDYIRGGCEINLVTAIDFTASNGDPKFATSLHFQNPLAPNEYISAINEVGNILQNYDTDQQIPVFGFGGKVNGATSHCFALNGNIDEPEVQGVAGIISAYQNIIPKISLSGPTNFSEIIKITAKHAEPGTKQHYVILLILTDGEITDFDETKSAIVDASHLPMSIVIVGVGSANFDKMQYLDSDDQLLTARNGKKAARDIVQFVPFRDFRNNLAQLTDATLKEIPEQIVGYFKQKGIQPNPPPIPVFDPSRDFASFAPQGPFPPQPGAQYPSQQPGYPQQGGGYPGQYPSQQTPPFPLQPGQQGGGGYLGQYSQQSFYQSQFPPGQFPPGGYPPQGQFPPGYGQFSPAQQYPPQQGGYPPQGQPGQSQPGQYPPQGVFQLQGQPGSQYPLQSPGQPGQQPQHGQFPPQQGGSLYPPQQGGYPPQGQPGQPQPGQPGQFPPQQGGYPPQGQPGQQLPQPGSQYPLQSPGGQSQKPQPDQQLPQPTAAQGGDPHATVYSLPSGAGLPPTK